MNAESLEKLLKDVSGGGLSVEDALKKLKHMPYEDATVALVDHHRAIRQGYPEVIFGQGKTADEIITIMTRLKESGQNVLVTRLPEESAHVIKNHFPDAVYYERAKCMTLEIEPQKETGRGKILIISAGTSDRPVAEEALITARFLGHEAEHIQDVGVAGLHRLLNQMPRFDEASVFIVVAGMEGALPSVVGGLVDKPVIAVPTSVGYGASFGGLSALLGMLNSCASGVAVVNIDNGFGAAYMAALINKSR